VFAYNVMLFSMLDLNYESFGRGYLRNCTVWPELAVSCHSSCHDLVRGSTCCCAGIVEAHCQLSESTPIATLILSEASYPITLVMSEFTVGCQSPHIQLP